MKIIQKRGPLLYTIQAALEYMVSLLVTGSFLATLTKELEISDHLTGILSSVISLGGVFQLISLFLRVRSKKRLVLAFSVTNQLLFMLLYILPIWQGGGQFKGLIFTVLIISAYVLLNAAYPKKISWLMSLIDDHHRGRFTANKEIVSLLTGMIFTFVMGSVIDYFKLTGQIRVALILTAIVIFSLLLLHTLVLVLIQEPDAAKKQIIPEDFHRVLKNKSFRRVTVVFALYYIGLYISTPFYGTYQISELGLSLTFISVTTMIGGIARILISNYWGRYADRTSFSALVGKCLLFLALSKVAVIFAVPQNGGVMFVLYQILFGIGMGGISGSMINLVFEVTPVEDRGSAIAINQAIAGVSGFLSTMLVSPLVAHIQQNNNRLFGVPIYAQQVVSVIGLLFMMAAMLYVHVGIRHHNFIDPTKQEE